MSTRSPTRSVLVLVVGAVLAACAGTATPPPQSGAAGPPAGSTSAAGSAGASRPDPCSLLTPADLKAVLGSDFQPGTLVGSLSDPSVQCEWAPPSLLSAPFSVYADDLGSNFGCAGGTGPVGGLGRDACIDGGGLHVNEGTWEMVLLGGEKVTKQQLIDLAKIAISHT